MTKLDYFTRLKVKRDTVYLPDPEGGVYIRNNESSFRMKGGTIYQWIEKLIPMFNGEQTMEELTKGLTLPYQNRVYEIGEILLQNGFVRDVSQDRPHQLHDGILEKYASQIEFIENFVDSGAYHFQQYRQTNVLLVGSGPILVSLIGALIETGHPNFHYLATESIPTNRQRIYELIEIAHKMDSEVEVKEVTFEKGEQKGFWKQAVNPYDCILYVSQDGSVNELRELNNVCKDEGKVFIPAICFEQVGLSGPVISPESDGCWESAWRRLHQSAIQSDQKPNTVSSTTGALLANVIVFEFFKKMTGIAGSTNNQIYRLDFETLEGEWLSFIPHPLVSSTSVAPRLVEDLDVRLNQEGKRNNPSHELLDYFSGLSSEEIGIFHSWEEGDLSQLPLAQCLVQAVNPVSEGPADLLPEVICAGLTHEEAKRNAGFRGIEMYVSKWNDSIVRNQEDPIDSLITEDPIGIGAGETIEEAVCRGMQAYLDEKLCHRMDDDQNGIYDVGLGSIEDQHCSVYLDALTTLNGTPTIDLIEDICGFPVIRVRSKGQTFTSAGLNLTLALRNALQQALLYTQQNQQLQHMEVEHEMEPTTFRENKEFKLDIPSCEDMTKLELLRSSIGVLHQEGKQLFVYDLAFEPFFKEELAGVFGVQIVEEGF
ncbi:putative thiazole-containing bacteriocin maturation protein [Niallia sp. Krafla_26]|uniref:putative thiazole-containing bacteriocin maturation protein n=1 Tax=Niallia sp. Krafla_26 TaxID=3064703 RepID=UPI003D1758B8